MYIATKKCYEKIFTIAVSFQGAPRRVGTPRENLPTIETIDTFHFRELPETCWYTQGESTYNRNISFQGAPRRVGTPRENLPTIETFSLASMSLPSR